MSGPRHIMCEPLLMSGPRDNYVGAPFLLFWGSEIIMVGPALPCEDPDLLCPGPKIIMWEPDYVGSPTCHVGTPRYGDPDLLCGGRDNYVWAPIYDVGAPTYHDGAPDSIWLSKYLIFLITFIFGRCHCSWASTTLFKCERMHSSNVSWQYWKIGNNGMKVIGLRTPSHV